VRRIISTCAVGSLRDDFEPGTIVLPDQFIDFTKKREHTFYDDEAVHVSMADPFCPEMRELTSSIVNGLGYGLKEKATYFCIEGPRFSTKAESKMFKQFADVIGMTLVPECQLSREKAICYLCIAMVTDYDVYGEKPVTAVDVKKVMEENAKKVQKIIWKTIEKIPFERGCNCREALEEA
jgi:methylthioadenosine phosphorylase (EC 2.4.2.28)